MAKGTGNTQDQKSLVNVLNRLAAVLESQKKSIDKISTSSDSAKSTSSKKSEPAWDYRAALEAEQELEDAAEDRLQLEKEIQELYREQVAATKALGTEEYKQLNTAKALSDIQRQKLDLADKITDAYKKGDTVLLDQYKKQEDQLDQQKHIVKSLKEQGKAQDKLNKKVKDANKDLEKAITLIKNPLETLGKELEKNLIEKIKFSAAEANNAGKSVSGMGTAFKLVAGAAGIGLLISGFKMLWDSITGTNERLVDLQRSFGISREESQKINKQVTELAGNTSIVGANTETLTQAYKDLAAVTGQTNIDNKEMLETQVLLTKQIGMTGQEAASFQSISAASGQTANQFLDTIDQVASKYEKITGDTVNQAELAKDLSKTSKKTLATFKGDVKALTAAAIQAKKMGMSLEDTQQTADKLLNIESSLQAEMQANVLTGKSMNMNQARLLALQGKTSEAAAEAVRQAGSYDEFMKMAPYQQEAVADAAGMTVDQLVKAGELQKFSSKLANKELKSATDLTEEDIKKLETTKAISAEKAAQLRKDKQSATFQENMAKLMDKLKGIFNQLAGKLEPVLDMLGTGISKFLDGIVAAKDGFKSMIPPGIKDLLNSDAVGNTAAIGGTIAAAVGVGKLVKSFFGKKKPEEEVADNTKRTADNTEGLGGGKNVGSSSAITDAGAAAGSDAGSPGGGIMGKLKDKFTGSKLGKKFAKSKVGKFAGKAMGFLGKTGLGSMATDLVSNATGIDVGGMLGSSDAPAAPSGGGGGGGTAPKADDAAKKLAESSKAGQSSLTSSAPKAAAPTAPKKGGGFFSKIGSFISEKASKLNPLNALKGAFKGPGLKKILSKIPKIGGIVSAAMSLGSAAAAGGGDPQEVGKQIIMALGDMGGSLLGTFIPVPGIGTLLGGYAGSALAGLIADNVDVSAIGKAAMTLFGGDAADPAASTAPAAGGASIKPATPSTASATPSTPSGGGSGTSTAAVKSAAPAATASKTLATTAAPAAAAGSGAGATAGGSISETNSLLKQLIAKVDQPINMTIGTKAIGEISKQTAIQRSIATKVDSSYSTFV